MHAISRVAAGKQNNIEDDDDDDEDDKEVEKALALATAANKASSMPQSK
jgi:hypothetical protein